MMTKADMKAHEKVVSVYTNTLRKSYKAYADFLEKVLKELAKPINPLCIVGAREKSPVSFSEKSLRKWGKYKGKPLTQMTDLAGGRIITNTQDEVKQVCAEIETLFTIDWANTVDTSKRLGTSEFGYRSVHYIVQVPKDAEDILGVKVDGFDNDMKAEIQVRTLLEHAWSDVGHDRFYKSNYEAPNALKRELAVCAAEMEQADKGLDALCNTLADQFEHYGVHRSKEDMDSEIEINERMLAMLTKPPPRKQDLSAVAAYKLQLAELYAIRGEWKAIYDLLREFLGANKNPNRSLFMKFRKLWAIFGNACCQPAVGDSSRGVTYLKQAMNRHNKQPANDRIHAQALIDLGQVRAAKGREAAEVFELYYSKAATIDPENPYILSYMLSAMMYDALGHRALHAMAPMLTAARRTCQQHIRVGISPWWSHFALGRLCLLAGDMHKALEAYCLGIRYYHRNAHIKPERFYAGELEFVRRARANISNPNQLAYACVEKLIELARRQSPEKSEQKTRYTIIAGRTDPNNPLSTKVARDLRGALLKIENVTFLSGGTKSGVCGVVGDVLANPEYDSVKGKGYLPEAKWNLRHPGYGEQQEDFCLTEACDDFSPLEALQMWNDLFDKKVAPESVHVLGVGGGDISVFEYQLAAILGARVSVVLLNAHESADDLIKNDLWYGVSELFFPPTSDNRVAKEVLLFGATHEPSLPPNIPVNQLAIKAHEAYNKAHRPKLADPAREDWPRLSEDLKESNRQQTIYGELVLRQGGYTIKKAKTGKKAKAPNFSKDRRSFDNMARYEHARWMIERFTSGWKYADRKDAANKLSPYLVAWDQLDPEIRQYDNYAIQEMAENLCQCGYAVVKMPKKKTKKATRKK